MKQKIFGLLILTLIISNCSTTNKAIINQMKRPKTIDKDAKWLDGLWKKGKSSNKGIPVGRYTVWNEEGELMHDANFFKTGEIIWLRSYYPNMTIGRDVIYNEKTNKTTVIYKSDDKHCSWLLTPLKIAEMGYAKKVYDGKLSFGNSELFNGTSEGVTYYSESGEELFTASVDAYNRLVSKYKRKAKKERWEDALSRLENYFEELKKLIKKERYEGYEDYFSINFQKNVSKNDIVKAENKLGVKLPKSYKEFILEKGLITFGQSEGSNGEFEQRMLHPNKLNTIDYFLDPEGEGDFDNYYQITKEKRSKLIGFFIDQEDMQYEGWIGFDCTNSVAEEYPIIDQIGCYTIYDWEKKIGKKKAIGLSSMDLFISSYVDKLITDREP